MTLRQLRWVAILAPVAFLLAVELVRSLLLPDLFPTLSGFFATGLVVLVGAWLFINALFAAIDSMQRRLAAQNHELLALHEAGLAIAGELDLDAVLQRIVDRACELIGSRYGALSLLGEEGGIESFLTAGLTPEERAAIGPLPVGHGLLGVVLVEGQRLRLPDIRRDPRSVGFPPNHPPMRSLLAVPIVTHETIVGNLYLTEKREASEFSADDEEMLVRFATLAAVAIDNARLHRRVQANAITEERERIAREMHDGVAQVLGYVNTKAQAAQALLASGQTERASGHIAQLAKAAQDAYSDVRETILGLRTSLGPGRSFADAVQEYARLWEEQTGITTVVSIPPAEGHNDRVPPIVEVQLIRIIQEAMANVRKHAGAHQVAVHVVETPGAIEARVVDDGVGFDPAALTRGAFPRFGLATMRERAESIGGALEIASAPGRGTTVTVRVPIGSQSAPPA